MIDQSINSGAYRLIRCQKPPALAIKLNSDGICIDSNFGIGGVIRDNNGKLILAYSRYVGPGINNLAKSKAMLYGLQQCWQRGFIAEADSKLVTSCVNEGETTPWRIIQIVEEIKGIFIEGNITLQHCYREANKIADKLATMSHTHRQKLIFTRYEDLPKQVKGLMQLDKWELASFRVSQMKKAEINYEPP